MFDVTHLFIIFKISSLFSFFIITKWLQEERAGKYTLNFCFKQNSAKKEVIIFYTHLEKVQLM